MKILTISGSARPGSSNSKLLENLDNLTDQIDFFTTNIHFELPLFRDGLETKLPDSVELWRNQLLDAEGVIISTPEYIHCMPAVLKNAFEWVTASGEFAGKKVLLITYTPHAPRGQKAMQSLIWTMQALNANILTSLELYKSEIKVDKDDFHGSSIEILSEALKLFFH